jgi:hypothetical protein
MNDWKCCSVLVFIGKLVLSPAVSLCEVDLLMGKFNPIQAQFF